MATSLTLAREAEERKRENIKNKLERMQSAKKQKLESAFETVQSNDNPNIRRIADLALIIKGCSKVAINAQIRRYCLQTVIYAIYIIRTH